MLGVVFRRVAWRWRLGTGEWRVAGGKRGAIFRFSLSLSVEVDVVVDRLVEFQVHVQYGGVKLYFTAYAITSSLAPAWCVLLLARDTRQRDQ